MAADSRDMPPVRLLPDAELARLALTAPLLDHAARLARWTAPRVGVNATAELVEDELARATVELGFGDDPEGAAHTAEAWAFAVDTGLVEVELDEDATRAEDLDAPAGTASPGKALGLLDGGDPREVIEVWRTGLESVLTETASAGLADLFGDADDPDAAGAADGADEDAWDEDGPEWDPREEAAFLEGALGNLYLLTALEETGPAQGASAEAGAGGAKPVPLPVLAASMVVPDDMDVPTDAVLEEVSEAMMRLDDHFRLLAPTGLVDYQPVDDALIAEEAAGEASDEELPDASGELAADEVSRYGMVRLTPLGVLGVRERLLERGVPAPVVGDLTDASADRLLDALVSYPQAAAYEEGGRWLERREPVDAARELLAAARGDGLDAPARRLIGQQTLGRLGPEAEPALREVLDDRELGGLARVWLVERGAADVPAPDEAMVFWLTVDTLAAQLAMDDDPELLGELVRDLVARHEGFFDAVWRVDHPATAEVLDAMGRLHPDKRTAKEARKAAFKARSKAPRG
ncbi:hypothetical protein K7472_21785 [Streptomyces sp. PTM05]|uniref:Uncharacterized protein n=1 Tax=Streptantibioticus parmotrematis TaxID=2873249 RepID=A0ABS7QXQ5_9ACTN|nr:hypothetical protein [Streptantibioticus parmotrematis]MBY8887449.1 hypothetical protein [Streptantibioticus parmotrematis]